MAEGDEIREDGQTPVPPTETGETAPDPAPMIPKGRLDAEIRKREGLEGRLAEYERAEQARKDDEKKRQGKVEEVLAENKTLRSKLETFEAREASRLDTLLESLSDEDRAVVDAIAEKDLGTRLVVAERLSLKAKVQTETPQPPQPQPGFGGTAGPQDTPPPAKFIPADITEFAQWRAWVNDLNTRVARGDQKAVKILAEDWPEVVEEARARGFPA